VTTHSEVILPLSVEWDITRPGWRTWQKVMLYISGAEEHLGIVQVCRTQGFMP